MSRLRAIAVAAFLAAIVLSIIYWSQPNTPAPVTPPAPVISEDYPPLPPGPTVGEEVLAGYADPDQPPRHDLELVSRLLHSYRALVKAHATKPIGCNADLVEALLGLNPSKQVFLPKDFVHLSDPPDPKLLDRWRTPLIVHPLASDRYELRSAGPDLRAYTEDDVLLSP